MSSVTISFKYPIGKKNRNGRWISSEIWKESLKEFNEKHEFHPMTVCYADVNRLSIHPEAYTKIRPESIIGYATMIDDERAVVEIKSETKCAFISDLVNKHGFRLEPRGLCSIKQGDESTGEQFVDYMVLICLDLVE